MMLSTIWTVQDGAERTILCSVLQALISGSRTAVTRVCHERHREHSQR